MSAFVMLGIVLGLSALPACRKGAPVSSGRSLEWMTDLPSATAKREGRPMIVEFSTTWCPYCLYLDEKIFTQTEIVQRMEQFALLRFDGDRPDVQPLMDRWNVGGFPTFIILGAGDRELVRFNDINSAEELIRILDDVEFARSGHRELREAMSMAGEGKKGQAIALYRKAADLLTDAKDPAAEEALAGLLDLSREDLDAGMRVAAELIGRFPLSPLIPVYEKRVADLFSSPAIKESYFSRAAARIEEMLAHPDRLDARAQRIFVDQLIDLEADLLKELKRYSEIQRVYREGAILAEKMIDGSGGEAANRHLIGTVVSFFLNGGELDRAFQFLDGAEKVLPDHWPVFFNRAKVLAAKKSFAEAAEVARKAYGLAEEVAKPRVALLWAEILAADGDSTGAIRILTDAEKDLEKTGAASSGRAAVMVKKLKERMKEYAAVVGKTEK